MKTPSIESNTYDFPVKRNHDIYRQFTKATFSGQALPWNFIKCRNEKAVERAGTLCDGGLNSCVAISQTYPTMPLYSTGISAGGAV